VPKPHTPTQNHLLAVLTAPEQEGLFPQLELMPMPLGGVLHESGSQLGHVCFPTTCIVSLLCVMEEGSSAEIAAREAVPPDQRRAAEGAVRQHLPCHGRMPQRKSRAATSATASRPIRPMAKESPWH